MRYHAAGDSAVGRLLLGTTQRRAEGRGLDPQTARPSRPLSRRRRLLAGSPSSLIELGVPVRVSLDPGLPALRHPLREREGDAEGLRQLLRLDRSAPELHARLLWRLATLALVARDACNDDVRPR